MPAADFSSIVSVGASDSYALALARAYGRSQSSSHYKAACTLTSNQHLR